MELTTTLLKINTPTPYSNRIYNKKCIENIIEDWKNKETCFCEIEKGVNDPLAINLDKISHQITNMYMEGDELKCTIKILDTPYGKILKTIAESTNGNFSLDVSGRVDKNNNVISKDLTFVNVSYNR